MRKKLICILCSIIYLSSGFDAAVFADRGGAEPCGRIDIGIGDYIQLGKYRDIPILWRYVADDENGKLILSDKILCLKEFDAEPTNSTGSHITRHIPTFRPYGHEPVGSNYWGDSNIRSWLNSKAPAGEVEWLCGNPPLYYADEMGFLSDGNFSQSERSVIKKVRHKTLLDDADPGCADGGDSSYWGYRLSDRMYLDNIYDFMETRYDNICYEYTEDMMFLLDLKQLIGLKQNSALLGDEYYIAYIAPDLLEINGDTNNGVEGYNRSFYYGTAVPDSNQTTYPYFLRTPYAYDYTRSTHPTSVYTYPSGTRTMIFRNRPEYADIEIHDWSCDYSNGIRPAFYLNEDNTCIVSGSGAQDDPYVLTGKFENNEIYDKSLYIESNYKKAPKISVFLDGSEIKVSYAYYNRERFDIPLEDVVDAMGATLECYNDYWRINIRYKDNICKMSPLCLTALINGKPVLLKHCPANEYGISNINPFILEDLFGVKVDWSYPEQRVYITQ